MVSSGGAGWWVGWVFGGAGEESVCWLGTSKSFFYVVKQSPW